MRIDAVGVTTRDMEKTIEFYKLLGFDFEEGVEKEDHVEPIIKKSGIRLMIDNVNIIKEILGTDPKPANHSIFAILYDSASEVDKIANSVKEAGYKLIKEPWDAFWGQRYAIVADPDGYKIDLFAPL
ncbi:VOC family protein [Candidatus Dojkabacteria bacterium]|uniref:VOC family protein n=1 Tax=Candidatus Dojkabacteria bacterium TaxID=2099670 RepID=A0A955LBA5_9BACT|nr:VOC family protein [Candidatus Dojkabacteria bacterium]